MLTPVTQLKVTRETRHLFRRYSVYLYRDMLLQITDSGRPVNAYRTIHILDSRASSEKASRSPGLFLPVTGRRAEEPPSMGASAAPAASRAAAASVGVALSQVTPVWSLLLCFPSPAPVGRIPYVAPEVYKHIYIYLQVHKYINMAIIEK